MIYVARSKIAGVGVFTDRLIRPGHLINDNDPAFQKKFRGYNHSCEPNCLLVRHGRYCAVWFTVATRFIKKGEELTVDYRHGDWRRLHPTDVMKKKPIRRGVCKCPACRRKT